MTKDKACQFDTLETQLVGMYNEIGILSKKNPNGAANKFKLIFINEVIEKINNILGKDYLPFDNFTSFNEDELPTVSDIVFVLGQYMKSMDKYRFDNTSCYAGTYYWNINGERSSLETKCSRFLLN